MIDYNKFYMLVPLLKNYVKATNELFSGKPVIVPFDSAKKLAIEAIKNPNNRTLEQTGELQARITDAKLFFENQILPQKKEGHIFGGNYGNNFNLIADRVRGILEEAISTHQLNPKNSMPNNVTANDVLSMADKFYKKSIKI